MIYYKNEILVYNLYKIEIKKVPTDLPYFVYADDTGTQVFFCFGLRGTHHCSKKR